MKKSFFFLSIFSFLVSFSQSEIEPPVADQFEVVTAEWLQKSAYLKTYNGINEYCQSAAFRKSIDRVLKEVHVFDSLIISKLEDPAVYFSWNAKEERKTKEDVHALELDYGMEAFIDHMRESCEFRNEIEGNADNLKRSVGMDSYDGKVLILETEMTKYLKKIDKLVTRVDDHLHVLHIDQ